MKLYLALAAVLATGCASSSSDRVMVVESLVPHGACQQSAEDVRVWRGKLGLRDWTINLHCAPHPEYGDTADGAVEFFAEDREVDLWIHPAAANRKRTAVHELLHLAFSYTCEAESDLTEEQQLRAIARLLVPEGP